MVLDRLGPWGRLDRVTGLLVAVSGALLVAGPAARYLDYRRQRDAVLAEEPAWWARMFDLSTEANVPTWWSSVLLVGLSGLFLVAGALHRAEGRPGRSCWLLAGVAALLSLDEGIGLHEVVLGQVGDAVVDGGGLLHFTWVVPGAVVALAVGLAVLRASRQLPAPVRRGLVAGGAVFLAGALGVEAISGAVLDSRGHDRVYLLVTTIEEGLELAGVLLALTAARGLVRVQRTAPMPAPASAEQRTPAAGYVVSPVLSPQTGRDRGGRPAWTVSGAAWPSRR